MQSSRRIAIASLIAAGILWGASVPLSKLALQWLSPAWLTVGRLLLAAPLLALIGRRGMRGALQPRVVLTGAIGFGAAIVLQNLGIEHTSVSHAAVLVGAVPVLVALFATALGHDRPLGREWFGYAVASAGVLLVAGGGGGGATVGGDLLVFGSVALSALFITLQPRALDGRDPAAVTAVQFLAGGVVAIPVALVLGGTPTASPAAGPLLAFIALTLAGTLLPFWLFAFGQARVSAQLAGVFVNVEPVVGATIGWIAFNDPATVPQILGAVSVLAGIVLTATPRTPAVLVPIARVWTRGVDAHQRVFEAQRPWVAPIRPAPGLVES